MKNERETREKLLKSAKEEFMEKGYALASLRNICKNAGVTTGALYFFFKNKEDLFGALVAEPLERIYKVMENHYNDEIKSLTKSLGEKDIHEDAEAALMIVDYLYQYYDEFLLVFTKSQGSIYEKYIDKFIEISERHYRVLADKTSEVCEAEKIDNYMIHWFAHLQIYSFVELITHNLSREDAKKQIKTIVKVLISGWLSMFK